MNFPKYEPRSLSSAQHRWCWVSHPSFCNVCFPCMTIHKLRLSSFLSHTARSRKPLPLSTMNALKTPAVQIAPQPRLEQQHLVPARSNGWQNKGSERCSDKSSSSR